MLRYLAHPYQLAGVLVVVVLGLFAHNLAQAFTARMLGDLTAARSGWLRVSPGKQLDPLGLVAVALVPFGWGFSAAVPMNTRFLRRRARPVIALLAGPAALFLLLVASVALVRTAGSQRQLSEFALFAANSAAGLCVVSLLPFPPLALGRALALFAPRTIGWQRARYQLEETPTGRLVALGVLLLPIVFAGLPDIVGQLASPLLRHVLDLFAVHLPGLS